MRERINNRDVVTRACTFRDSAPRGGHVAPRPRALSPTLPEGPTERGDHRTLSLAVSVVNILALKLFLFQGDSVFVNPALQFSFLYYYNACNIIYMLYNFHLYIFFKNTNILYVYYYVNLAESM